MTAVVFLGFNLLNARRGVKPTLATLGARLVVVIRSCWIFALLTGPPITFQVACLFCLGELFGCLFLCFFVCFWCGLFVCCFSQWIVRAAGLCTGPLPVHFCGHLRRSGHSQNPLSSSFPIIVILGQYSSALGAKAVTRKRRIARCLQRNFSKPYIRSTVNVGYPRLMVQHPAHAQPARAFLHRSTVVRPTWDTHGWFARPWPTLHPV